MLKKLRSAYSAFVQKEYPLRLKIKASVMGTLGIFLLAIQNGLLHHIDSVHQLSVLVSKLVTSMVASAVITIAALGSSQAASSGVFDPGLRSGGALSGSSCQETFFCKHPCSPGSGSGDSCYTFCDAGASLGSTCTGTNTLTGICVGFCASTIATTLTSCIQQPYDTNNCAANDPCIGFTDPTAINGSGVLCTDTCGSANEQTFSTITQSMTGLCSTGFALVSGSLLPTSTGRQRQCGSPFGFDRIVDDTVTCSALFSGVVSMSGTVSRRGGRSSSILCGNGRLEAGEQCDDHNLQNGDGCNRYCRMEGVTTTGVVGSPSYTTRVVTRLRDALARFERSCAYNDVDYHQIIFDDIQRNPSEKSIKTLQAYCIVKGYTFTHNQKYHVDAATTIGEAIKVLTKIAVLDDDVVFDEFARYPGTLPYGDMQPNAWYTSYVLYAYSHNRLTGIPQKKLFGRPDLKALTPISKKQLKQLLANYGVDTTPYRMLDTPGRFVSRDAFATIVVHAFQHQLRDYEYMYGNNTHFYRRTLKRLEGLSVADQQKLLNETIMTLRSRDTDGMNRRYNFDIQGMIRFFEEIMR